MDLSAYPPAQLDELAVSLFDEIGKRKHQAKILSRLSNDGLKNLGFSILEEFGKRYLQSSDEDKQLFEAAFDKFVESLFPNLVLAARLQNQFIHIGEVLLQKFGPLDREGTAPKSGRNEIIDNCLTSLN